MRLIEYTPELFESLRQTAEVLRAPSLTHRPFVDYYYHNNPWCKLFVLLAPDGSIAGTLGIDRMPFAVGGRDRALAFGTNYFAARPGAGGYLFLHWLRTSPCALVFGGSEQTHRILRQQKWTYFSGVKSYLLNPRFRPRPGEPLWRLWARRIANGLSHEAISRRIRRLPADALARITVHEEQEFGDDLLPRSSPFAFRFAPPLDYLRWRYNTRLSFVRYRLFRIRSEGRTCGYVVLNDREEKLLVAHCDGDDAPTLAHGVLLSLAAATEKDRQAREVELICSHPRMQKVYTDFGFRPRSPDRSFAVGSSQGPVDLPADTSGWLVNYDWGDNGLRAPFLDQGHEPSPRRSTATLQQAVSHTR